MYSVQYPAFILCPIALPYDTRVNLFFHVLCPSDSMSVHTIGHFQEGPSVITIGDVLWMISFSLISFLNSVGNVKAASSLADTAIPETFIFFSSNLFLSLCDHPLQVVNGSGSII